MYEYKNDFFKKIIKIISPSYFFYSMLNIEREEEDNSEKKIKDIRIKISKIMEYFFFSIDFNFISLIFFINLKTIILKSEFNINSLTYIFVFLLLLFFNINCIYKLNLVINEIEDKENFIKYIIETKKYKNKNIRANFIKIFFRHSLIISIFLSVIMILFGSLALINSFIANIVSFLSVIYFITRPMHYCFVFYNDFKNKTTHNEVKDPEKKIRYINLTLSNYIKIILEFCILIYILKYMRWGFTEIKINTFFELVNIVISGELKANTGLEILINILRIGTLGMVTTLSLATYMSLQVKRENLDEK
ncbi:TPA: hypothetical protein I9Z33_001187 [Clostridium perfringens]|uniref:Uncharacterized protein n=3 Tax=Clostridium perfringens TaxID=1502 RepID=B1BP28_CLOPF|nr:hypothetical protein [Clostridium perfringens]EDT16589.1 conserved hypothetical protein [Clostridium perfringens E str. JGS1987]EJT6557175.1 hypothetical protein [Clostridium perfringens]TBX10101.1 hypothetical protein BFS04_00150 [Clostridium perfringens]HAT4068242.1 hypothetical protein [Clostridium perfringens]HAT4095790.1 hypothetical protein [Clostridium perfringens]